MDYETKSSYSVTVQVSKGTQKATLAVTINLTDVNERPSGGSFTRSVAENSPAGTAVGAPVTASDPEGAPLTYALTSNEFAVGRLTGQLTVKAGASLDYETKSSYSVTVQASDGANTTDIAVTINVTDVNEAPVAAPQTRSVAENAPAGTNVGAPVTASDPDGDALTYALTSNEFAINASTGQITVQAGASLDYETKSVYSVTVQASDGANTTDIAVTINLKDVNEAPPATPTPTPIPNEAPQFADTTATRSVAENSPAGTLVGAPVTATDPDGDTLSYQIVPANSTFTIESNSGQLAVAAGAELDYETTPSYTVVVIAYDPGGDSATITVTINVTDVAEQTPTPTPTAVLPTPTPTPTPTPVIAAGTLGGGGGRSTASEGSSAPTSDTGTAWWQLFLFAPVVARRRRAPVPVGVTLGAARTTPQTALAVNWRTVANDSAGPVRYAVQYRREGAWRWRTQRSDGADTALTLEGLQAGTRYEVRVRAVAGDEASRWVAAGAHRTAVAVRPITTTPEPIVIGWEASATADRKVVPITVTPEPIVIGWTAA